MKDVYTLKNYADAFTHPTDWKLWLPFAWQPILMPFQGADPAAGVLPHHPVQRLIDHSIAFALTYPSPTTWRRSPARERLDHLLLLLIPLWVSEILRSFAWFIILAFKGPLNFGLLGLGVIDEPIRWMTGLQQHHLRPGLRLHPVHAVPAL